MGWDENDLRKNGYVPDGNGGFRVMTPKEKSISKTPKLGSTTIYQYNTSSIVKSNPLFVPGDVMSKKNSKQIFINRKTGKPFITSSQQVKEYEKNTAHYYIKLCRTFHEYILTKEKPYLIEFHFVFSGKRMRDYGNIAQLVLDMMVMHKWIENDDMDTVLPSYKPYSIDRENPGVYLRVI